MAGWRDDLLGYHFKSQQDCHECYWSGGCNHSLPAAWVVLVQKVPQTPPHTALSLCWPLLTQGTESLCWPLLLRHLTCSWLLQVRGEHLEKDWRIPEGCSVLKDEQSPAAVCSWTVQYTGYCPVWLKETRVDLVLQNGPKALNLYRDHL